MTKEEKHLVGCKAELTYQKSDIFKTYRRFADNVALDNEILDNEDVLYITTLNKYNNLQQENKDLKKEIKNLQRIVISKQEDYLMISVGEITKVFKLNDNKKWINEVGDSNG